MTTLDDCLRERLSPVGTWQATPLRLAAVVCPLVVWNGQDHVVFVVRPEGHRQHAGQIAFPGGMREGDEEPVDTALRECHEEIGVPTSALTVLGSLGVRESSSGILVHGLVARMAPVPLVADPREVVRVLHVPLAELCHDARWVDRPPPHGASGRQPRMSPHFAFGDELLWGLTARFVRDLVGVLRG